MMSPNRINQLLDFAVSDGKQTPPLEKIICLTESELAKFVSLVGSEATMIVMEKFREHASDYNDLSSGLLMAAEALKQHFKES